jgi:hypothetical protein
MDRQVGEGIYTIGAREDGICKSFTNMAAKAAGAVCKHLCRQWFPVTPNHSLQICKLALAKSLAPPGPPDESP